jgi:hypothetical protein
MSCPTEQSIVMIAIDVYKNMTIIAFGLEDALVNLIIESSGLSFSFSLLFSFSIFKWGLEDMFKDKRIIQMINKCKIIFKAFGYCGYLSAFYF